ncbi:hypothetical protein PC129_g12818 [Phytophthora cactorum]|uniref:Uncharacterized protein n=2 Tax=Phytophthora cactorum TaxID=29920 RepID=A0A329RP36_9STRA|nr:hypothetical protein GQ600_27193 [Phytophthora cactorum]KAG2770267.1 hypothetical protein Pcac1_g18647 [Phytophthora cactorum]KAG2810552.1 hypothetical protein PC112_g16007 [Phytophthora cactorum]KAG2813800.1 hypothetical protein PC111_g14240 [Phytophthora cactorum]KAG2852109.1 hypothetical protein PC113_g15316 [Phytophthora cactorum]
MGRRGVQQLTAEQWQEALEQQIREKEQQRRRIDGGNDEEERRSHSAPRQQDERDGELIPSVAELERAATTSMCGREMDWNPMAGRRRCFQQQQSREDYLKGLQEQIEEKKRFAQEEQEKKQLRRHRVLRNEDDDDDAATRQESCKDEDERSQSKDMETEENVILDAALQDRVEDEKPTASSNQNEDNSWQAPALKTEVAADPVAITKIVDFCEELKKQNEDVKRQLSEQHAVLASLHSTLAIETDEKALPTGSRRRNSVRRGSVNKLQTKERPDDAVTASKMKKPQTTNSDAKPAATLLIAPRPRPMRGKTKIPLPGQKFTSPLRSAGADIVKGLASKDETQSSLPLQRAEAKLDASALAGELSDEKKSLPPDSQNKSVSEEKNLEIGKTRDYIEGQDSDTDEPKNEEEDGNQTSSSAKKKKTCEVANSSDDQVKQPEIVDDECPMDAESKLVHDWDGVSMGDGLLNCTSVSILDGPSSLIPIDQSVSRLF